MSDKKSKRIPAVRNNADVRRALRELDRRSTTWYKLEQVKSHQGRNKKLRDLSLEAKMNVKYDTMAKQAVEASIWPGTGQTKQTCLLENAARLQATTV